MTRSRLALRRETLTTLTEDGLASVHGGTVQEFRRITSRCPTITPGECGSIPVPMETQFCQTETRYC